MLMDSIIQSEVEKNMVKGETQNWPALMSCDIWELLVVSYFSVPITPCEVQ